MTEEQTIATNLVTVTVHVPEVDWNAVIGTETVAFQDDDGDYDTVTAPTRLIDVVADRIVDRLFKQASEHNQYWSVLQARINEIRDEVIRERLTAALGEAFARPIQMTNEYGRPTGPEKSLTELVIDAASKWPASTSGDSYSSNRRTNLQKLIDETVNKVWATEMEKVVSAEKAKVRAAVQGKAAEILAQAVTAGLGVKQL